MLSCAQGAGSNANSRIDNICLQQTNLVCNFGRQGLSAFCTLLATRASAFLIRFVKNKSRQTLSADLSAISKVWGEGPRHSEAAAILQTNFVCKCRQKGARFADKVCLKMQTNFADESFQDTSPQNADKLLQKCRRARWTFPGIADKLCRQSLSTLNLGTSAFWFVYRAF